MRFLAKLSFATIALAQATAFAQPSVDLSVDTVSFSPLVVAAGDPLSVTLTARSLGSVFNGNVLVRIYLSADIVLDVGDIALHDEPVFINGQANVTTSFSFTMPPAPPGNYRLIAQIDPNGVVTETDETNNAFATTATLRLLSADLEVVSLTGPPSGFSGGFYTLDLVIANSGAADANNFFFDVRGGVGGNVLFSSATLSLASGAQTALSATVQLPALPPSPYDIAVFVDPTNQVPEVALSNNTAGMTIQLLAPAADLTAALTDVPQMVEAGQQITLRGRLGNAGVLDVTNFSYGFYLSANDTITASDLLLLSDSTGLAAGGEVEIEKTITIPLDLSTGSYYIGLFADNTQQVPEFDEDNNVGLSPLITGFESQLQILTPALPTAVLDQPYEVSLVAAGGAPVTWSFIQGALPAGIQLEPNTGFLTGTPREVGAFDFVVRADAPGAAAQASFTLVVVDANANCEITDEILPPAFVNQPYEYQLTALGCAAPLSWSAMSLPQDLSLSPGGLLSGIPRNEGLQAIPVSVADSIMMTDTKLLTLAVGSDSQLTIVQTILPDADLGQEYCEISTINFEAQGGSPPYSWSLVEGEVPGLQLSPQGALCGVPTNVGRFSFVVRVEDDIGLEDTSRFTLNVNTNKALTLVTRILPSATLGAEYEAQLAALGGIEPYRFETVGGLPPGLSLEQSGRISGRPTTEGSFAMTVRVEDDQGLEDFGALSITVFQTPLIENATPGGCGCNAKAPKKDFSAALLLLVLFGFRRKETSAPRNPR